MQIFEVQTCHYLYIYDGSVLYTTFEQMEDSCHLWTIQDAKEGDVLVASDGSIFLFEGVINWACKHYVALTTDNNIKVNIGLENYWETTTAVHPATTEQSDLFFSKIKDAGYVWDAEKKELRKIDKKFDKWEPQTGDIFRKKGTTYPTYYLCNKREDGITFGFVENREVGISGGEITIFALKQSYELMERPQLIEDVVEEVINKGLQTKVEQKSAWSEEDEEMFKCVISHLNPEFAPDTDDYGKWFDEQIKSYNI